MRHSERIRLHFGPYRPPHYRLGQKVQCAVRGPVTVAGFTKGRIRWPFCRPRSVAALVVCGGLEKAVRCESAVAIVFWWGVKITTVRRWRRALGVARYNPGTLKLREAGYDDPARSRKISKTKTGKSRGPLSIRWKARIRASVRRYYATKK